MTPQSESPKIDPSNEVVDAQITAAAVASAALSSSASKQNRGLSKMHQRVIDAKESKAAAPQVEPNNYWDQANGAYQEAYEKIVSSNSQLEATVSSFMVEPEIAEKLNNNVALAEQIRLLTKDIQHTLGRLSAIKSRHAGRTGGVTDPQDLALVIEINGEYKEVLGIYHANVRPSVVGILEKMGVLEAELNEIRRLRAAGQAHSNQVH